MRKLGPHSRPDKLQIVDGRLAEGKLMARVRAELTQHLGGKRPDLHLLVQDYQLGRRDRLWVLVPCTHSRCVRRWNCVTLCA